MYTRLVTLIAVALAVAVSSSAGLEVCNESPFLVNVAVGFPEGGAWKSSGWYRIEAGQCGVVIGGNLTNRYYYVHAEDETDTYTWGDDVTFCTKPTVFTIAGNDCAARGFKSDSFAKVDTRGADDFRFNLTCNPVCTRHTGLTLATGLPRISHTLSVAGRSVEISATGTLDVDYSGAELKAKAVISTDLGDFQRQAGDIIRAQVNHNDDCDYILNVHTISLSPDGRSLRVYAAAHYEDWECPVADLGPLGEISGGKHRLFEQNGDITAQLTPQTDGNDVSLSVNIAGMEADGIFGVFLDSSWFGPYIRDLILQSVPELIRVASIRDSLPAPLRSFPVRLNEVAFYDRGNGRLGLRVVANAIVPANSARTVWELLK